MKSRKASIPTGIIRELSSGHLLNVPEILERRDFGIEWPADVTKRSVMSAIFLSSLGANC